MMETTPPLADTAYQLAAGHLHTRLLYPFFLQRRCVKQAVEALVTLSYRDRTVWYCAAPYLYYRRDMLGNVQDFLFDQETGGGCRYLKVNDTTLQAWFHNWLLVRCPQREYFTVQLPGGPGIELFISPYGIGVLSITLLVGDKLLADSNPYARAPLEPGDLQQFNYRAAQVRHAVRPNLLLPHPNDHPLKPPPTGPAAANIPPAPALDAPFSERLGAAGGVFTLDELKTLLLSPLQDSKLGLETAQNQFTVYTVARFPTTMNFQQAEASHRIGQLLSSLAQVEERQHAGAPQEDLLIPNELLNSRHWAAVSYLGAAHAVADQTPEPGKTSLPFNEERLLVSRDKYFIGYLLALLQRLTLQRAIALEVFIVSFYAAELAQLIGNVFPFNHTYTIFAWAVGAAGVSTWGLKPWQHNDAKSKSGKRRSWIVETVPAIIGALTLWWVLGWQFFPETATSPALPCTRRPPRRWSPTPTTLPRLHQKEHVIMYQVRIEFLRVQTFLFAVPRLQDMIGANVLLGEAIRVDLPKLTMEIKWLISHVSQVKKLGRNIYDQFRSACIP